MPPQLRGLPKDSVDVRLSKTLAYLLRHGAEKEGLPMRQDGYVKVQDLVSYRTNPSDISPFDHDLPLYGLLSRSKDRYHPNLATVISFGISLQPTPAQPSFPS